MLAVHRTSTAEALTAAPTLTAALMEAPGGPCVNRHIVAAAHLATAPTVTVWQTRNGARTRKSRLRFVETHRSATSHFTICTLFKGVQARPIGYSHLDRQMDTQALQNPSLPHPYQGPTRSSTIAQLHPGSQTRQARQARDTQPRAVTPCLRALRLCQIRHRHTRRHHIRQKCTENRMTCI